MNQCDFSFDNSQKSAVFARLGSRPIPRVTRMMDVARNLGYQTMFLGARREKKLVETETYANHSVRRIGPFFPLLNGRSAMLYICSVVKYNCEFFRQLRLIKPDLIHCSDIETMPAGIMYKWISNVRLIYNIHDNLAQRYNIPSILQGILNIFEGLAVLQSSVTLVPESFRRNMLPTWCRSKASVVRNTPADRGMVMPPQAVSPVRIFFGGWLDEGRGLRQLIDLARNNEDLELTLAGEGDSELVNEINDTPGVRYVGFIPHEEIMAETARAHIVAAFYDPIRPINKFAASNKLAEALACGRPVLVNSEMLIVEQLKHYDCLIKLPYCDIKEVALKKLNNIMEVDGEKYRRMCVAARGAYEDLYSWELAQSGMEKAIKGC